MRAFNFKYCTICFLMNKVFKLNCKQKTTATKNWKLILLKCILLENKVKNRDRKVEKEKRVGVN